ncbi:MAG: tetratricopeptide repeat protein [Rhodospirillaceae bacterium]|nr:tetratricopeptide repeat protein [Rhodospirillaceae bacterium]
MKNGLHSRAKADTRAMNKKGKQSQTAWERALKHHHAGRLGEAERLYWHVLIDRSDDDVLLSNLGAALRGQGKQDQAVPCYRRAIVINPDNWQAHGNLGNALRDLGERQQAEKCYRKSIELDPSNAEPHCNLGQVLKENNELDEAADCFRRALELRPAYLEASIALSAIEESAGRTEQATDILWNGVSRQPVLTETCKRSVQANVLLFRGVEDCRYKLSDDFQHKMSGGHFSTSELLHDNQFTKHHFHIANGNLDSYSGELPRHDIIVNTVACPDREPKALKSLSAYLKSHKHAPLINDPDEVLKTGRDMNYQRLKDIKGITFPTTIRLTFKGMTPEQITESIKDSGIIPPLIMRRTGTQSAVSTRKLDAFGDIADYLAETDGDEFYVIQYVDCRYRDDYYRKLRLFCIDGKLYPVVCHIDQVWNVHGGNRKTLMKTNDWMQDEEKSFLNDPKAYVGADNYRLLENLHDIIKLDFFGVDFNLMADNSILIYELNPAMRHSLVHAESLPYLTPSLQVISDAFARMTIDRAGNL